MPDTSPIILPITQATGGATTGIVTSLTTTGTSGASTLISGILNIPIYAGGGGGGTVTSVALSVPIGLSVSGSPITSSGTLALTLTSGYSIPTTISQTNWDTAYTNRITSLTTTGTSGAATLIGNVLNIPQYSGGSGTVTSVAALTIGTTGTDVTSTVANSTTTPVITLNIPDASATARGLITTGVQTIAGSKTFNGSTLFSAFGARFTETGGLSTPIAGQGQLYAKTDKKIYYKNSDGTDYDLTTGSGGTVTSVGLSSATSGVTIGSTPITTSGTITLAIATASGSQQGLLSSTDWTTFNNKQNALTNPVTGTGTINYIPKFTGGSTIGNSDLRTDANNNLGLGVTPSAWSVGKVIQVNTGGAFLYGDANAILGFNAYYSSAWKYVNSGYATYYEQGSGEHRWNIAPSGTAGNPITFTQAMTLTANNRLLINQTGDTGEQLQVNGTGRFSDELLIKKGTSAIALSEFNNGAVLWLDGSNGDFIGGDYWGLYAESATSFGITYAGSSNILTLTSTGAATFSSIVSASSYYSNGKELITSDGSANYIKIPAALYFQNASAATVVTISNAGAATFSSSVTAKGDMFIWGGNAAQSGQITANSAGGGLYIAASGTNQNIRLVPSGTGIVQSIGNFDVSGTGTFSSSVTATELFLSTSNGNVGNINSTNANGGYLTWQTSGTTIADIGTAQQIFGAGGNDTFGINARGVRSLVFGTNNTSRLTIASTGAATFSSTIKTAAPTGGTAQPWKLGSVITDSCGVPTTFAEFANTLTDKFIEVEINGVFYHIPVRIPGWC